jgi:hypothetical protein
MAFWKSQGFRETGEQEEADGYTVVGLAKDI